MTGDGRKKERATPPRRFEIAVGSLVGPDERVVVVARPSLLMVPLEALGSLVGVALLVAGILAWRSLFPGWGWTPPQAVGFGLIVAGVRLGWLLLEWMNRLYVLTDRRVVRRRGVIRVDVFEARLDRIQQTSLLQPLRQRLFGLGTIAFATAGTGTIDAFWTYLPQPHRIHADVAAAIDRSPDRTGPGGV